MLRNVLIFIAFFLYPTTSFSECIIPKMPPDEEWQNWLILISNEAIENYIQSVLKNMYITDWIKQEFIKAK